METFWEFERTSSGLADPDDESDESCIDADDATIWERGESTRRCANSFSYIGIRADDLGDEGIGGVSATDEVLELTDSIGTTDDDADAMTRFFDATNSVIGGVGATDGGFESTWAVTGGVGATDGGFELTWALTGVVGATDGGFDSTYVLTDGVDTIDGGFELTYALTGGAGRIDGFLFAINSESNGLRATGALDD